MFHLHSFMHGPMVFFPCFADLEHATVRLACFVELGVKRTALCMHRSGLIDVTVIVLQICSMQQMSTLLEVKREIVIIF